MIRYFFHKRRLLLYSVLSLGLAAFFVCLTGEKEDMKLFFLFFTELWFLRLTDDRTDYEKDLVLGKMQLKKGQLRTLIVLFAALFLCLNLLFFGSGGIFGAGLLILISLKDKSVYLPTLIGFVSGVYYIGQTIPLKETGWKEGLFLLALFCFSIGYGMRKRERDDG